MKRREFVRKAGVGAAAGGVLGAVAGGGLATCGEAPEAGGAPAVQTGKRVMWRLVSSFPRSLDTIFGAAQTLADRVEALTGGQFRIRVYPAGEIVPGLQVLDAVQKGTVQCGHTASYYFIGKNPALAFDCCVPFGLRARQQNAWLYRGGGLELMRGLFSDFGIVNFPGGNTGVQMGGWFRGEIGALDDLRGLKMRIPGLGGRVMDRLGATVQVLAGGEIYQALERGTIDAAEWVGPYDDEKLGFHKVAPYYYYPGWWEPGPVLSFYVGQKAWDELPVVYKEAFETASREANQDMLANYDAKNPEAFERLKAGGTEFRPFPEEVLVAARREAFALMEEEAAADPAYAAVFEPWKKVRTASYEWFATSENAFAAFSQKQG